jgi:hypothetical protein
MRILNKIAVVEQKGSKNFPVETLSETKNKNSFSTELFNIRARHQKAQTSNRAVS